MLTLPAAYLETTISSYLAARPSRDLVVAAHQQNDASRGLFRASYNQRGITMEAVLNFQPVIDLTEDQFFEFCQLNRDVRIERNAKGEILVMPPTGGVTGAQNAEITMQLGLWAKQDGTGVTFDSSTGFVLPDRSVRSPDGAWVARWRYDALTEAQKDRFLPLCPEFVIELKSPSDYLPRCSKKWKRTLKTVRTSAG